MAKSKKIAIIKNINCLNCSYPFTKQEKFCPDCGQKNKSKKVTLGNFIREVFAGFFSWDTKFWKTLFPLLIKPGKISKDYIQGKRIRYVNPFRFYLTTSIIFFLIFGLISNYNKIKKLSNGKNKNQVENTTSITPIIKDAITQARDTLKKPLSISPGGASRLDKFMRFNSRNPNVSTNIALDSLQFKKTFFNRFIYNRAAVANSFVNKKEKRDQLYKQMLSYGSIALFILLPMFALFLKPLYIRKKLTYVEHLIFVFHTQTLFFLLLIFYVILDFFIQKVEEGIFLLLFLIYLFIAMKNFYQQSYIKTFIKFSLLNIIYIILACIGFLIVGIFSFAFI